MRKKMKKAELGDNLKPKALSTDILNSARLTNTTPDIFSNFQNIQLPQDKKAGKVKPIDVMQYINPALTLAGALVPEEYDRFMPVQPLENYNPNPYGTGSQAIAKKGAKLGKAQFGEELDPPNKLTYVNTDRSYLSDAVGYSLAQGGNPLNHELGKSLINQPGGRKLIDAIIAHNSNPAYVNSSPDDRINNFYSTTSEDKDIEAFKKNGRMLSKASSPSAFYHTSPNVDIQGRNDSKDMLAKLAKMPDGGILGPINFANSYRNSPEFSKRYKKSNPLKDPKKAVEEGNKWANTYNPLIVPKSVNYSDRNNPHNVVLSPGEAKKYGMDLYNDILPHEFSHLTNDLTPTDTKKYTTKNRKVDTDMGMVTHDSIPSENHADMNSLRYLMYKEGIYDTRKGNMTKEQLEKAMQHPKIKNQFTFKRMLEHFTPEDIIELNNTVAQNDSKGQPMARNGRKLKMPDGGNLAPVTITGFKDKKTREYYKNLQENYPDQYYALLKVGQNHGFSKLRFDKEYGEEYSPATGITHLPKSTETNGNVNPILRELPHKIQFDKDFVGNTARGIVGDIKDFFGGDAYKRKGSVENEAHSIIQPKLEDEYVKYLKESQSDPTYFKKGGQIGQPLAIESSKPISEDTHMITGNSHADGGTMVQYGDSLVEAEKGEPLSIGADGRATIWGNLTIPGTKEKFKNVVKKIGEQEAKYDKLGRKGMSMISDFKPATPFDKIKLTTGKVMAEGAQMGKDDLFQKKEELSELQSMLLAKKDQKKARNGAVIAAAGYTSDPDPDPLKAIIEAIGKAESGSNYNAKSDKSSATGKYQMTKALRQDLFKSYFKPTGVYKDFEEFDQYFKATPYLQEEAMRFRAKELDKKYDGNIEKIVLAHRLGEGGMKQVYRNADKMNQKISVSFPGSTDKETPAEYLRKVIPNYDRRPVAKPKGNPQVPAAPDAPTRDPLPSDPFKIPSVPLTQKPTPITPVRETPVPPDVKLRVPVDPAKPSNVRPLDFMQVAPELLAFAQNKVEPVPMQQVNPQLYSDYNVSYQDRLNDNNASFRALTQQLGSNPTALQSLAANKYAADSQVEAEEFRTNQAISNDVNNKNVTLLNQAQTQNLGLSDQQMVRQSQARSNTRTQNGVIFNSLSNKYAQNALENKTLAAYENLYDFRMVDTNNDGIPDDATYFGAPATFTPVGDPTSKNSMYARKREEYDGQGNLRKTQVMTPSFRQMEEQDLNIQKKKNTTPKFGFQKLLRNFK